jgi:mono/diheme cytochrome c family protein
MVSPTRSSILVAVAALAVAVSGCGNTEEPDLANGKRLYTGQLEDPKKKPSADYQPCGACHALVRAGTTGTAGPDLDASFSQAREDGMTSSTIEGVVHGQILHPRRGSTMPAGLVTGDDARDVAAYVGSVAGQPGKDRGQLASIGVVRNDRPIAAEGGVLTIPADETGALAFASSQATAEAGSLQIRMPRHRPQERRQGRRRRHGRRIGVHRRPEARRVRVLLLGARA